MVKKVKQPVFQASLLGPKHWPTWLLLALMFTINLLPFRVQMFIGRMIGKLLYVAFKSRRKIALRNIELCFPEKSAAEREIIVKRNIENTGIAMLETTIAWWWPDWRLRSLTKLKGYEHVEQAVAQGKGVLLLMAHSLHLELDGRIFGMTHEGIGFYRPHNNPLMEYFQYNGRCKSNKYMVGKRNIRGLIDALKQGEVCYYLPDQDYGRTRCEFVPFFAVKDTATTTGTLMFAEQTDCAIIPMLSARLPGGQGYEIELLPAFDNMPSGDKAADVTRVNQWVEQTVGANIDQYMWVHRRFKTQPDPEAAPRY